MSIRHLSLPALFAAASLPTLGIAALSSFHRSRVGLNHLFDATVPALPGVPASASTLLFVLYYAVAAVLLSLYYSGTLARHKLDWLIVVLAATVFPAVYFL